MQPTFRYLLVVLLFLLPAVNAHAADGGAPLAVVTHDVAVPAGTLMECTLSEPSFSSATTSVGDPFLCYPRNLQEFGRPVFPRGAYLVGHLEDAKEPGHFVGKGYLKMTIDRIGLPTTDIPVRAKVISVAGYRVDKEGKVIGKGHATRDVVEWMLPPLWPWKILTLPAKGPRPTLKGEVRLIMRVMDDFIVPQQVAANMPPARSLMPDVPKFDSGKGWHRFGEPAGASQKEIPAPAEIPGYLRTALPAAEPAPAASKADDTVKAQAVEVSAKTPPPSIDWPRNVTVFALTDSRVIPVLDYWRDGDTLMCVLASGDKGSLRLDEIDWSATAQLNWRRGIRVSLHGASHGSVNNNDVKGD